MNFPISIIKIQDQIVLCQGQITSKFKKQLNDVNSQLEAFEDYAYSGEIAYNEDDYIESEEYCIDVGSYSEPYLSYDTIRINGTRISQNYRFKTQYYTEDTFNNLNDYLKTVVNKFNELYGTNYVYDNTDN